VRTVVLVEGESDRIAVETLAARRGRDLASEGVAVVAVGGAHALPRALRRVDAERVAGLYDRGEEAAILRALDRAGITPGRFYACDPDLEGELVRALGPERMLQLVEERGPPRRVPHVPEAAGKACARSGGATARLAAQLEGALRRRAGRSPRPRPGASAAGRRARLLVKSSRHPRQTGIVRRPSGIVRRPSGIVRRPSGIVRGPSGIVRGPSGILPRQSGIPRRCHSRSMDRDSCISRMPLPIHGSGLVYFGDATPDPWIGTRARRGCHSRSMDRDTCTPGTPLLIHGWGHVHSGDSTPDPWVGTRARRGCHSRSMDGDTCTPGTPLPIHGSGRVHSRGCTLDPWIGTACFPGANSRSPEGKSCPSRPGGVLGRQGGVSPRPRARLRWPSGVHTTRSRA
jgi:hypothetical protein